MDENELLLIIEAVLKKVSTLDYIVDIKRRDKDFVVFTYKSGSTSTIKIAELAIDGIDGKDGNGVIAAVINDSSELVITTRDGDYNLGVVVGKNGRDGVDGKDGIDGDSGQNGKDGRDGVDGSNGKNGQPGKDGKNGKNGSNGSNGKDGKDGKSGKDGIDGLDGNGIKSIKITQGGKLIIETDEKIYDLGVIKKLGSGGGGGVEEFYYTNSLPMPSDVGGYPAGTTFSNVKLKELWTKLLYAFEDPIFSQFEIPSLPIELEVGQPINSGTYNASWVIDNPEMLEPNSIKISYVNDSVVLASNLANTGSENINIPEIIFGTPTTITFKIEAENTMNDVINKEIKIPVKQRIYYGESYSAVLTNSGAVTDLRKNELATNINGEYEMLGGGYKWFCYPSTWGDRTNFYDVNTGLHIPMTPGFTVLVTNAFGIEESYRVYRTYNTLGGNITVGIK